MEETFEIHAICQNPTCTARELVVLQNIDSVEKAFDLKKILEVGRSRTGVLSAYFPAAVKKLSPASLPSLPEYLECQTCHTMFPYQGTLFLVARAPEPKPSVVDSVHI